jgi:hypothetical protein
MHNFPTATMILFLSVLGGTKAVGQNPYVDDNQEVNGRFWQHMTEREKGMYLIGVSHGLQVARKKVMANTKCPDAVLGIVDVSAGILDDYRFEFDKLYTDSENLPLNLITAFGYVDLKLKGTETKDDLEKLLISLRQTAAKHVQH